LNCFMWKTHYCGTHSA